MNIIIKNLVKQRLIRFILYIFIILVMCTMLNYVGHFFVLRMFKDEIRENFTDKELAILEEEFEFVLYGNEKVDYARCLLSRDIKQGQVWIINVKEPKEFIKKNLHLSYKDFKESIFQPYSKSKNGKHFYNYTEDGLIDETGEIREIDLEKDKMFIKGLKYEKIINDFIIQIYKLPNHKTYTVTIFKGNTFNSQDIWSIF